MVADIHFLRGIYGFNATTGLPCGLVSLHAFPDGLWAQSVLVFVALISSLDNLVFPFAWPRVVRKNVIRLGNLFYRLFFVF